MSKFGTLFELDRFILDIAGQLLSLLRLPLVMSTTGLLKNNRMLPLKRRSDRCFIAGLGPSLRDVDLSEITDDIIVTNRFNRFDSEGRLSPRLYVTMDSAFFNGDGVNDLIDAVRKYTDTTFVFNGLYKSDLERVGLAEGDFHYVYSWRGTVKRSSSLGLHKPLPIMGNVVCLAIAVALYMGYKEINLLGCDFSSFASPIDVHCYEGETYTRKWTLGFELFSYAFVADTHYQLAQIAKDSGIRIVNLTKGSLLDAYPRE